MNDTEERVDLSDLDLLDDANRHAVCLECIGRRVPILLVPYEALCGRRTVFRDRYSGPLPPPNACPECVSLWKLPCKNGHLV